MGGFFWEDFFGGFFWEDFFVRVLCLRWCVKILVFVKILSEWRRRKDKKFRSLEVRRKYIALKKGFIDYF